MKSNQHRESGLPIRRNLGLTYALSFAIAVLIAVAAGVGLIYRTIVYPTADLVRTFLPNDVVNLCIGLPVLLGSMGMAWRGKLIGLLCWPGALLFVIYVYLAYIFALPFSIVFLVHLTLVMLSVYTLIGLVTSIDGEVVHKSLTGAVRERIAGGVLIGLGLLFILRVVGVLVYALISGTPISGTNLAVNASDFLIAPALVIGGVLLWQRKEFGYVSGLGLLFQASMLFIALIVFMLVQPFLTAVPLAVVDVAVVFAMGLISFIPFSLFVRGVVSKRNSRPK